MIKVGATVLNSRQSQKLRVAKLLKMHANKREEVDAVHSGDIAATVGLKDVATGDTLCDERHPILLDTIQFPEPVVAGHHRAAPDLRAPEAGRGPGQAGQRGSRP